jgi:hypothetical protein
MIVACTSSSEAGGYTFYDAGVVGCLLCPWRALRLEFGDGESVTRKEED